MSSDRPRQHRGAADADDHEPALARRRTGIAVIQAETEIVDEEQHRSADHHAESDRAHRQPRRHRGSRGKALAQRWRDEQARGSRHEGGDREQACGTVHIPRDQLHAKRCDGQARHRACCRNHERMVCARGALGRRLVRKCEAGNEHENREESSHAAVRCNASATRSEPAAPSSRWVVDMYRPSFDGSADSRRYGGLWPTRRNVATRVTVVRSRVLAAPPCNPDTPTIARTRPDRSRPARPRRRSTCA